MKETLDEAADKYEKTFGLDANGTESIDFLEGAKWQAERSYSEEELLQTVEDWVNYEWDWDDDGDKLTLKEWFNKLKKK